VKHASGEHPIESTGVLRSEISEEDEAMRSLSAAALTCAAIVGLAGTAVAAKSTIRVRGEIQSVRGNTLNVRSYNGKPIELVLDSKTKYHTVVPAHLSDIKKGDFVGVGATGPKNDFQALEVVIFPSSMRGTGEGHYAWSVPVAVANADRHTTSAALGAPTVGGTMTNGTVIGGSSEASRPIQGTMTNGTVATSGVKAGGRKLAITYNNGNQMEISVPSGTPVVRLTPGQHSELKPGAKIFSLASEGNDSTLTAKSISVGKSGLMPPM
jgi:hypothetical protein